MESAVRAADAAARECGLDVERSFLVQAPAGSGKTELLIRRFLALLARVDRPERIVAMTFTRKAAGEMRERIVRALREAEAAKPVTSPHEGRVRDLACAALAQDKRHGWNLIAHPARLAVQTIDALSAGLARQAPLATRLGAAPRFEERAQALYVDAVRDTLASASAADPGWRTLLAHWANDAGATVTLLAGMLGKRDQWLRALSHDDRARFRATLEATLAEEVRSGLEAIAAAIPPSFAAALAPLERHAALHLDGSTRASHLASELLACADAGGRPPATVAALNQWRALASWLLVANHARFRAKVDKNDGFPSKGTGKEAVKRQRMNTDMKELLGTLEAVPGLAEALDAARRLPTAQYMDETWAIVSALLDVLPRLAAQLMLTFGGAGAIDFTQGTMAALSALGSEDAPTDLLLRLDLWIEHLLIDEFQDTSFVQLALIRRLTAGWQPGDGRTLFAVGDPMQSIYRFRDAEVRIFVEAQAKRQVGDVPVENLVLARNFRSHAGLVNWVNGLFPGVLGSHSDPWRGVVAFSPAIADAPALPGRAVTIDLLPDDATEAECVVDHVRSALEHEAQSIAVLVRARTHLDCLLPALRTAGIDYAAVELDALAERQAVLDLVSLTHALTQPADRLAWLAVLRAPWCGLALPDLFAVAAAADAHPLRSIAATVEEDDAIAGLSEDGRARLERIARYLRPALAARGRASLARRVRGAWLALGGAATLDEALDIDAAERYFALLAEHEVAGDIPDWAVFVAALDELRAEPGAAIAARVQVMTLHRAKGLEFDTVIMPGLARASRRGEPEALRWRLRPQGLLLAPARARGGDVDPVHAYLGYLADGEERAELARLLYVGCTRAKSRLHLTAKLASEAIANGPLAWKRPAPGSSLARLWDSLGNSVASPVAVAAASPAVPASSRLLARFPTRWMTPLPEAGVPVASLPEARQDTPPFDWARETARHIGVVVHRLFAQIAREGPAHWNATRLATTGQRIRMELAGEGVDAADLDAAVVQVEAAVRNVLGDARGRWVCATEHAEAASEWALAGVDGAAIVHVVLDRTFVADGVRWIIDFKTGSHEGADVEAFLAREVERYRGQLERYGRLVAALDARPIRLALYYPLLRAWREWPFQG